MGLKDFFNRLGQNREIAESNKDSVKPGKFCDDECAVSHSNCKECLEAQEKFQHALYELERIEKALDKSEEEIEAMAKGPQIEKCDFCGAPYEEGRMACPYCGTKYPIEEAEFEIPLSQSDRVRMYHDKVLRCWKLMAAKRAVQKRLGRGVYNIGAVNALANLSGKIGLTTQNYLKEKVSDIESVAYHVYGVPVSLYISGVASAEYQTPKTLSLQQVGKEVAVASITGAIVSSTQNRNVGSAPGTPTYSGGGESAPAANNGGGSSSGSSLSSSEQLFWKIQQDRAKNVPKYGGSGGGGGNCCGTCKHYYNGNCAKGNRTSGASDYCTFQDFDPK